ncbi:hypothetical protein DMB91_01760 [Campylobacter sp. MIT 97-5078]|uniref:hypothetical protein n=1 Tax=Campylobacter sp. MIT 97-5078 TaxID=1548153 RepID=UPI000512AA65|nr:hypothetical protein [Campylobacter sp. MIT 97-5078]KGI56131.1 hypothetical protein LR59_08615 [Campylobacter sp. MIT 97-5078]TQR27984.1 hypothetical protein DMB91_01760 [Campylobacter sp. MIT 97-5078]
MNFKPFKTQDIKIQIVAFQDILYTNFRLDKLENIDEESLFERALAEFDIQENLSYVMSFIKSKERVHIFLTLFENLYTKEDFALSEAVILRNLQNLYVDLNQTFAVLVLQDKYAFIAFFKQDELLYCKNIPKLCLNVFKNKNTQEQEKFFIEILLTQAKCETLLKQYQSQTLLIINDHFNLSKILQNKLFIQIYKDATEQDELYKKLAKLEIEQNQPQANFLRNTKQSSFSALKGLVLSFSFAFVLSFCGGLIHAYLTHHTLKTDFHKQVDQPSLNELEELTQSINLKLEQKQNLIKSLESELASTITSPLYTLSKLFAFLDENDIKIISLELENENLVKIVTQGNENKFEKLYNNDDFILKQKISKDDIHELHLRIKDE